jgi:hypothetical protein
MTGREIRQGEFVCSKVAKLGCLLGLDELLDELLEITDRVAWRDLGGDCVGDSLSLNKAKSVNVLSVMVLQRLEENERWKRGGDGCREKTREKKR